ncbi:MAG: 7-carboxy-7-deazaguanine synthase QueE [Pseudomonadota bacterium]|nr:7-carboxy-7-deazaguanine synthase QueE [Pseudomonadota bacterium]
MSGTEGLRVTEIFLSVQGESRSVGWPTVFIRLTGCPLRCQYCDTAYAFHGGSILALDAIINRVDELGVRHVTVTGGEPLAQPRVLNLLVRLCDQGYKVSLETSGAVDIGAVDPRVSRVVDFKSPGSGEVDRNLYSNVAALRESDQVKFVICDRGDYCWAKDICIEFDLNSRVGEVLFSPSASEQSARQLAEWILEDRLEVRFQIQLHKILWGDEAGR